MGGEARDGVIFYKGVIDIASELADITSQVGRYCSR